MFFVIFLKKEKKNILAHIHYIRIINIYCYFFNYICHLILISEQKVRFILEIKVSVSLLQPKQFLPDFFFLMKFIYSEKATKFCKIFTLLLSYVVPVKSKVKILQNFVAFSEYMNFKVRSYFKQCIGQNVQYFSDGVSLNIS